MAEFLKTIQPCVDCFLKSPWLLGIAGSMLAFKIWVKLTTGKCSCSRRLDNTTAIVTGANAGIGLETARDFAKRGARLVMVCRDVDKAKSVRDKIIAETGNGNIVIKHVDFASLSSVRECANEILMTESNISILLNNAGIVCDSFTKTKDGHDTLMQTNYFGPFLFTNLLLGRIRKSAPSRIVNVSSETHKMAKLDLDHLDLSNISSPSIAYGNSKLCNILMANELARKMEGTNVAVNSVTPGVVLTGILHKSPAWFRISWNFISKIFLKNPEEGAQTSIHVCVSPYIANISGEYFKDCKIASMSDFAKNEVKAGQLWELSEKAVNLQPEEMHYDRTPLSEMDASINRAYNNKFKKTIYQNANRCHKE